MTQVDFYVLPQNDIQQRMHYACRLTDKAYRSGHQIYLHTEDEDTALQLDELLWSFKSSSFIPHALFNSDSHESVNLGWHDSPGQHNDVLINLTNEVPEFFSRFQRISEIIVQEPKCRDAGRVNFKFYRDRGYPLQTHKF
jgi:DNA polymerase-3 subunit chi